jgi:hypothetical protein
MDICLDLSTHCIETELKRIHSRAVAAYFKAPEKEKALLEQTIEAVRQLLETADFPKLRTTYPSLAGGTSKKATLSVGDPSPVITVGNTAIPLILKRSKDR